VDEEVRHGNNVDSGGDRVTLGMLTIEGTWRDISAAPLARAVAMTATVQTPADHVIPDEALNRILGLSRTSETDPDGLARVQVVKAPGVVYRVVFGGVVGHLRCDDWDDGTLVPFVGIKDVPGGDVEVDPLTWDAVLSGLAGRIAAQVPPAVSAALAADPSLVADPAATAGATAGSAAAVAAIAADPTLVRVPGVARHPLTGWFHADAGTGVVTRASLQAAVEAAAEGMTENGRGGIVFVPQPPPGSSWIINGTVTLRPRVTVRGSGRTVELARSGESILLASSQYDLVGNGVDPIFQAGSYVVGSHLPTPPASGVRLEWLSMRNTARCVELNTAGNFAIVNCEIRSFFASYSVDNNAIRLRDSYRGVIERSLIGCQNGWCVDARDNINGVEITGNVISGGSAGGGIQFGQSVAVTITSNVMEVSKWGIISGPAGTSSGTNHNPVITGNYFEECQYPLIIGETFVTRGGVVTANYIGGSYAYLTSEYAMLLGRIDSMVIEGNTYWPKDATKPYFRYVWGTDPASTPMPVNCRIANNSCVSSGFTPLIHDLAAFNAAAPATRSIGGQNIVATKGDMTAPITGVREWVSPTITANVGTSPAYLTVKPPDDFGGRILRVTLECATGSIGSQIQIGSDTVSALEVLGSNFDPSTLTLNGGSADIPVAAGYEGIRRNANLRFRVIAGSGTGSYRVRITYHGA
jgi:hypothetical protein